MDHRAALIFAASLLCGSAHAFYAQATPPTGFVAGAINTFNGAKAGATASLELGRIAANASINVGGKAIALASRTSLAANAARVAALAIYAHPAVRVGVGIATWVGLTGYLYNATKGVWEGPDTSLGQVSDGYLYYEQGMGSGRTYATPVQAAQSWVDYQNQQNGKLFRSELSGGCPPFDSSGISKCPFTDTEIATGYSYVRYAWVRRTQSSCPTGWYQTPAGCVQTLPMVPVPQEQFVRDLSSKPMPPNILPELPFDLPVEVPYIEPIFVPTGNPVKNPNYDPSKPQTGENQPYVQPGVKIDPANDAKNPFQVNVQPSDRPTSSPNGSTDPKPITPGSGTETDGSNDQPKEDKDERDLCEKNPDILACQKVDTEVPDDKIPKAERSISFQAENVFGGGSCPANQYARVGGQQYMVADWTTRCDYITSYVKPIAYVITLILVCGIVARALE